MTSGRDDAAGSAAPLPVEAFRDDPPWPTDHFGQL
jgi:hypothetical protein